MDHLAAIVERVEAGESVRQILGETTRASKPLIPANWPTRNQFRRALAKDNALNIRYKAAIAKWTAPHARSLMHFDEIERRIIAGGAFLDVLNSGPPTFPDGHSFRKLLNESPQHAARYKAAFRTREAGPNPRGVVPKYSDEELLIAANLVAQTCTRHLVGRIAPNAPHARTLMTARRRTPELCAAIETALVTRITRLQIKDGPMFRPLTPGLLLPRRTQPVRIYERHVLKRALNRNEMFSAVDAVVPRYFQPSDREDIIAQTVLEMIEDELDLDMVGTVAREVISEHFAHARVGSTVRSLDAPFGSDSSFSLADTLTTW